MKNKALIVAVVIFAAISCFCIYSQNKEKNMKPLTTTDPEFAALFDNFINNDVIPQGNLPAKTRMQVILISNIATQSLSEFKIRLNEALDKGITPVEAKEIIYQSVPYLGIGKVRDFIMAANEIFENRGIKLPLEGQSTTTPETRFEKGLDVQISTFGERIKKGHETAPANQKFIQNYLSANCFGDYYTRTGLDIKTRELLTFAMLISFGGVENQVKGHVQGNLNVGNGKDVLLDTIAQLVPFIGYPRSLNAIAAVNEIIPEN